MRYSKTVRAIFLSRPNRFIAKVLSDGREETVHVKNTGRCKELLIPGATVYLSVSDNPLRKTKYDLVAVEKTGEGREPILINMDSSAPNEAVAEWIGDSGLFPEGTVFSREVVKGNSRFDFSAECNEKVAYVEVKGVTLEENGRVFFPDAPTERGLKHLRELISLKEQGTDAYVIFVVQMKGASVFSPNAGTHREFAEALRKANEVGVKLLAVDCKVSPDSMQIDRNIEIDLSEY
jgi:sugar fermentation stimulation protein A